MCVNKSGVKVPETLKPANNKRRKCEDPEEDAESEWTIGDVMKKLLEMDARYTNLSEKYENQVKITDELKSQVMDLQNKLEHEIDGREQRKLQNNVLVKGISQTEDNENLEDLVKNIGNVLKVEVKNIKAFRLGKGQRSGAAHPAPIKICFDSKQAKDKFWEAKKKTRLTTKDLGYENSSLIEPIYIDHDLTRRN